MSSLTRVRYYRINRSFLLFLLTTTGFLGGPLARVKNRTVVSINRALIYICTAIQCTESSVSLRLRITLSVSDNRDEESRPEESGA